jgi:Ca2+-binding EF-hand superfamily protein
MNTKIKMKTAGVVVGALTNETTGKQQAAASASATANDGHITSNKEVTEQISKLRIAIHDKKTRFGTKLGLLNDLFSALDFSGDGAVLREDFLLAFKHVGLKGKKDELEKLVDALDVDGDGDVSFVELCDGLMRRMQDAKQKHSEMLKRKEKEKEKLREMRRKK